MIGSPEAASDALPRLHLVTDASVLRRETFGETVDRLLDRGRDRIALHLRGPGMGGAELWRMAARCAAAAQRSGSWLLINDRVDVALGCAARGVQLGQKSLRPADARVLLGPRAVIGASIHDPVEAEEAVTGGADFLLAGTLYTSGSHPEGLVRGLGWLRAAAALGRPVLGIGGIVPARVVEVRSAGAYGVAVLAGVWSAPDQVAALDEFLMELE